MPKPADLVAPAVSIAAACMPLECAEAPKEDPDYEPFGICNLMLKLALGSIAPFMPMLNVILGLPGSLLEIPGLPDIDLMGLPWAGIDGPDLPPIPLPDLPSIGSMPLPELPALGALIFGILTLPLNIAIGFLKFELPDLSFDGLLDLVLGAIGAALKIPALMIPTIGLLDLAICVIALIIMPILLILAALGPFLGLIADPVSEGGLGMDIAVPTEAELEEMHNLTDEEKRAKAEDAINRMAAKEAAAERAAREAALNAEAKSGLGGKRRKSSWKPGLGDDFYG